MVRPLCMQNVIVSPSTWCFNVRIANICAIGEHSPYAVLDPPVPLRGRVCRAGMLSSDQPPPQLLTQTTRQRGRAAGGRVYHYHDTGGGYLDLALVQSTTGEAEGAVADVADAGGQFHRGPAHVVVDKADIHCRDHDSQPIEVELADAAEARLFHVARQGGLAALAVGVDIGKPRRELLVHREVVYVMKVIQIAGLIQLGGWLDREAGGE